MADKKMVEAITAMDVDFAQWYTDVVKKAELIDYTSVKGCMVIKPAGYAIWELIQSQLDAKFKETGVENVYLPMFIPESLLQKEKDHVEGFAPEVAWVTHGGLQPLQERLCVRPTSIAVIASTIFLSAIFLFLSYFHFSAFFQNQMSASLPLDFLPLSTSRNSCQLRCQSHFVLMNFSMNARVKSNVSFAAA